MKHLLLAVLMLTCAVAAFADSPAPIRVERDAWVDSFIVHGADEAKVRVRVMMREAHTIDVLVYLDRVKAPFAFVGDREVLAALTRRQALFLGYLPAVERLSRPPAPEVPADLSEMDDMVAAFVDDWAAGRVESALSRTAVADAAERRRLEGRVRGGSPFGAERAAQFRVYESVRDLVYLVEIMPASGERIVLTVSRAGGPWKIVGYSARRGN